MSRCSASEAERSSRALQQYRGLFGVLDPAVVDQRNHDELDSECRGRGQHQVKVGQQRLLRLSNGLPERRLHETVAGQAWNLDGVDERKAQDFGASCRGRERVVAQSLLIEGPFHPAEAERLCPREFLPPFIPGKRLDLAVDQRRQPPLHEADALLRRSHGLSPVLMARPFVVQPPSTNSSCPVM